jgi:hypothetical protein
MDHGLSTQIEAAQRGVSEARVQQGQQQERATSIGESDDSAQQEQANTGSLHW